MNHVMPMAKTCDQSRGRPATGVDKEVEGCEDAESSRESAGNGGDGGRLGDSEPVSTCTGRQVVSP